MYFKYILFGILFFSQSLYAELNDEIIDKFTFPKYDTIAHSPIEISYKDKKGTVFFINEKDPSDKKGDLKVYFLTKDNQELNQAFEISSEDYTELVSAFVFKEKKNGDQSIFILTKYKEGWGDSYRYWELPLLIDNDGVLRAFFFIGDDASISRKKCIDNFNDSRARCEYATETGLKRYLDKEINK